MTLGDGVRQVHAESTERFLTGRCLTEEATLSGALAALLEEVQPDHDPELADAGYRRRLAANLLYKVRQTAHVRYTHRGGGRGRSVSTIGPYRRLIWSVSVLYFELRLETVLFCVLDSIRVTRMGVDLM